MGRHLPQLQGQVFGRLTVVRAVLFADNQHRFECLCACGNITYLGANALTSGKTQSCGCLRYETRARGNLKHGASRREGKICPEYNAYYHMRSRCLNKRDSSFPLYGGRGIGICSRWLDGDGRLSGFECFLADVGPRPGIGYSIDRFPDNDGSYEPSNCRWATAKEQARNRRSTHSVRYAGSDISLAEACDLAGVNYDAAKYRESVGKPFDRSIRGRAL